MLTLWSPRRGSLAIIILLCLFQTSSSSPKQLMEEEGKISSRVTTILVETNAAFTKPDQSSSFSNPTFHMSELKTDSSPYSAEDEQYNTTKTATTLNLITEIYESTTERPFPLSNSESTATKFGMKKSSENETENWLEFENRNFEQQSNEVTEEIDDRLEKITSDNPMDETYDMESISATNVFTNRNELSQEESPAMKILKTTPLIPSTITFNKTMVQKISRSNTKERSTKPLSIKSTSKLPLLNSIISSTTFSYTESDEEAGRRVVVTEREPSQREIISSTTLSKSFEPLEVRSTSKAVKPPEKSNKPDNKSSKDKRRREKKERKNRRREKERKKANQTPQFEQNDNSDPVNRLPSSVVPVHYVLRLSPELAGNFLVKGVVEIELEIREPTHRLKLHLANIDVKKSSIEVTLLKAHKKVPIRNARMSSKRQTLALKLGRRLKPGRAYVLSIEFSYRLKREAKGFYKVPYLDQSGDKRWIATTRFWPSNARRAFPCFDDPDMKSTFDVHIAHTKDSMAISNMPVVRSYRIEEYPDLAWDQFATTPKISTYLLAFAITDFSFVRNKEDSDIILRVWTRDELLNRTQEPLDFGVASLGFFEKYFGIKYPLPKLDIIALPVTANKAMKNWGLLTFRESSLVPPEGASHSSMMQMATLVAHQIAQQWFGSLVTFRWDDVWLNEGFATYLSYFAVNEIDSSWNALERFVVDHMQRAMALDGSSIHPVNTHFKSSDGITGASNEIIYSKEASIIRMMHHFLTEETFKKGLQNYVKHFSYKNANQDDLWSFLNKAAVEDGSLPVGVTLKSIMDTWTKQSGYPVISVIRSDNTSAILSQQRFPLWSNHSSEDLTWWVPITFTSGARPSFRHTRAHTWFRQGVPTLKITGLPPIDQWVIFNLQATGYYRVNYDSLTWTLLIEQLKKDPTIIHVTNRAQLIDDAMHLAMSGNLSYNLVFELLTYLRLENNFMPWLSALRNLRYINLMLKRTKDYGAFKKFVFSLMDPLIGSIGMEELPGDPAQKNLLRAALRERACQMDHPICVQEAVEFFEDWKNRTSSLRYESTVDFLTFCVGIRVGDEELWNFLWDISQRTKDTTKRVSLLKALGCTRQVWILSRYLQAIGNPALSIPNEDAIEIYEAALETAVGEYVAWEALFTSWENFKKYSDLSPGVIKMVTAGFNTHYQMKELDSFYTEALREGENSSYSSESSIAIALNSALATTQANINWLESSYGTIIMWLSDNGFTSNLINLQVNIAT